MNYYNENDPFAAAWLRELIKAELIGNGEVDERSIEDVQPSDVKGFQQCHFFAGIGVWSYALRCAGWGDDRPVWTGSCPCQPFSAAGQRKGTADERHLWPTFFHLIQNNKPVAVLGEQVASKDGLTWLDTVHDDLENEGYAVGAVDFGAASVGAPHIRQRIYFVADSSGERRQQISRGASGDEAENGRKSDGDYEFTGDGANGCTLVDSESEQARISRCTRESRGTADSLADSEPQRDWSGDSGTGRRSESTDGSRMGITESVSGQNGSASRERSRRPTSPSYWSDCDWLPCIDGKTRPVEPGTFPLAHGIANRVGTLRGYGNALVAPQAEEFVRAVMAVLG